jgi:hypothetical protein
MKTKRINLTLVFLILFTTIISAQLAERVIKEEYNADQETILNIDSKFGQVEILNWTKPLISVEVRLKVESDHQDYADETLQKLNAELTQNGNEIFIKTIVEDKITSTSRRKVKFSVDYTIYAPEWINVKLLNKYGSVFIEVIDGMADINVQYGSLNIRKLGRENVKPLNQLSLAYSKGSIENASWLKANLAYSKLSIEDGQAIICISKYSSLSSENVNSLVVDSKYDTHSVNTIRNFAGEMKYSNLKMGEMSGKMSINSSYTNVKVDKIMSDFESLAIENVRGGYRVGISENASFNLNGEAYRGDITVDGMDNLNRKVINSDKTVWGTFGEKAIKGEINIVTRDGGVKVVVL